MTRPLACLVSAAALFGGACTSTHHVPRPVSVAELAGRAEADAAGYDSLAVIYPLIRPVGGAPPGPVSTDLTTNLTWEAPVARSSSDAVYVATPGEPTRLLLPEVRGYSVKRHRRGAIEGAGIGAAIGAVAGTLFGASRGSDPAPVPMCREIADGGTLCTTMGGHPLSAGQKAAIGGLGLGVVGGLVGAVMGALVGHTDRFEF